MNVVVDIEADHLLPEKVSNIWCIVCKDIDSGEVRSFLQPFEDFRDYAKNVSTWIGHNIVEYDYPVLDRFFPSLIHKSAILDTLVLSRLLKFKPDDGEGQSLEAWGVRFGSPKHPSPDFSKFSKEMLEYCVQDVEINTLLYSYLFEYLRDPCYASSIRTEMDMAWVCQDMHFNGFYYDKESADRLRDDLNLRLEDLDKQILVPDNVIPGREYTPKLTKHGTISRSSVPRSWSNLLLLHPGCSFCTYTTAPFNPGSHQQLVKFLNKCGWKPVDRTDTGKGFKVNETNLSTLPEDAPEGARLLVERILIAARVRTLTEWEEAYDVRDGRIHGRFSGIGTWPGRMSHRQPNMANIATKKSIKYKSPKLKELATNLGATMRSLWCCPPGSWLVGTDMEAAHVRLFAHYIDDKEFTQAVISGDKKKGTDVHTLGAKIFSHLNCDRDLHKTFIFSFFNGAGPPKVAEIFGCSLEEARAALALYAKRFPGIKRLREELIPIYARQGWFPGLDGRRVIYGEEHGMFAGMLQSGESIVMKMANIIWRKKLDEQAIPFRQVNLVHDEFVTEVPGEEETAKRIGEVQSDSIREVGERLNLRCPLAGEYKTGKDWLSVH